MTSPTVIGAWRVTMSMMSRSKAVWPVTSTSPAPRVRRADLLDQRARLRARGLERGRDHQQGQPPADRLTQRLGHAWRAHLRGRGGELLVLLARHPRIEIHQALHPRHVGARGQPPAEIVDLADPLRGQGGAVRIAHHHQDPVAVRAREVLAQHLVAAARDRLGRQGVDVARAHLQVQEREPEEQQQDRDRDEHRPRMGHDRDRDLVPDPPPGDAALGMDERQPERVDPRSEHRQQRGQERERVEHGQRDHHGAGPADRADVAEPEERPCRAARSPR